MYQPLICGGGTQPHDGSNHSCCFAALFNAKDLERLANALIDGVRGDTQPDRDLLRREMLVDQFQALTLTIA
jgi:hypothetical protein